MLCSLGMGLSISTTGKRQFVAREVAIFTAFLPVFLLSSFVVDIRSMLVAVRLIAHIVVTPYLIAALQSTFLAGNGPIVLPDLLAFTLF